MILSYNLDLNTYLKTLVVKPRKQVEKGNTTGVKKCQEMLTIPDQLCPFLVFDGVHIVHFLCVFRSSDGFCLSICLLLIDPWLIYPLSRKILYICRNLIHKRKEEKNIDCSTCISNKQQNCVSPLTCKIFKINKRLEPFATFQKNCKRNLSKRTYFK